MRTGSEIDADAWSRFVDAHRAQIPRRAARETGDHVLIYAPDESVRRWIEHELFGEPITLQIVETLSDVVTSLTLVPPPWPQCLIVDSRAISSVELELLGTIRAAGWAGMVIAIGNSSSEMHRTLGVDLVVAPTLEFESLRNALKDVGRERRTQRMKRLAR